MNTYSLHSAKNLIAAAMRQMMETGVHAEPIMLHASPGVGKSAIVHQLAAEFKEPFEAAFKAIFKVWDVRVGSQEPEIIQGAPFNKKDDVLGEVMAFLSPHWWPKEGECGILFLDEIGNAQTPQQHACYRPVHDRTTHNGRKLPEGVIIIGASNLKSDKTGARGLLPALARRFAFHVEVEPTVQEFNTYGLEQGFDEMVMAYLASSPDMLVGRPSASEHGFNCPANWESVSNALKNPYNNKALLEMAIPCSVGSVVGSDFIGFLRNRQFYPDFDSIENTGQYSLPTGGDSGMVFTVVTTTASRIIRNMKSFANSEDAQEKAEISRKTDNLSAVLQEVDISTAGVVLRSLADVDSKLLGAILLGKNFPKLSGILKDVVRRSGSMVRP